MNRCCYALAAVGSIRTMTSRAEVATDGTVAARAAAIASVGAAVIHFAVIPTQGRASLAAGVFFASVAMFQLIWAVLSWNRPPALLLAAGIGVNLGVAALWIHSRSEGASPAGGTEAVRAVGICALLLECYVVMGAAWAWLRTGGRAEPVSGWKSALVLLGANSVVGAAVTVGLASSLQSPGQHPLPLEAGSSHQGPISEPAAPDAGRVTKFSGGAAGGQQPGGG